jgi:hypothetical protein
MRFEVGFIFSAQIEDPRMRGESREIGQRLINRPMEAMVDLADVAVFAERAQKPLDFVECTRGKGPSEHHGQLRIDYFLQDVRAPIFAAPASTTHRATHASSMGALVLTHIF